MIDGAIALVLALSRFVRMFLFNQCTNLIRAAECSFYGNNFVDTLTVNTGKTFVSVDRLFLASGFGLIAHPGVQQVHRVEGVAANLVAHCVVHSCVQSCLAFGLKQLPHFRLKFGEVLDYLPIKILE